MKISIITPTFNSEKTIVANLNSIYNQSYKNYEHIIVDNLSNDDTLNLARNFYNEKNNSSKLKIISEKDNGISHAFNKGITHSSGEIITILNSDDAYMSDFVFEKVIEVFKEKDILFTHGNIFFQDPVHGSNLRRPLMCSVFKAMPFNHPTMFLKKKVYEKNRGYDTTYKYAMDFEFVCRLTSKLGHLNKFGYYIDGDALVRMKSGGASWQNELKSIDETKRALKKYNLWNYSSKWNFFLRKLRTNLKRGLTVMGGEKIVHKWREKKWTN